MTPPVLRPDITPEEFVRAVQMIYETSRYSSREADEIAQVYEVAALFRRPEEGGRIAGECSRCGGPVMHRPGYPGEYDHECPMRRPEEGAERHPGILEALELRSLTMDPGFVALDAWNTGETRPAAPAPAPSEKEEPPSIRSQIEVRIQETMGSTMCEGAEGAVQALEWVLSLIPRDGDLVMVSSKVLEDLASLRQQLTAAQEDAAHSQEGFRLIVVENNRLTAQLTAAQEENDAFRRALETLGVEQVDDLWIISGPDHTEEQHGNVIAQGAVNE